MTLIGVVGCYLQITSATRKATDFGNFIIIKGDNLLFLREPVKVDGLHQWETRQTLKFRLSTPTRSLELITEAMSMNDPQLFTRLPLGKQHTLSWR